MKTTLRPGLVQVLSYRLTGAFSGLIQWAGMEAMRPHLGAGEHSIALDLHILHEAAAPAGLVAHVEVVVEKVEGRRICLRVKAYDGDRAIGEGTHERFVIDRQRLQPAADRSRPRRARAARARRPSGRNQRGGRGKGITSAEWAVHGAT